jgi:hypothetical protein
MADNYLEKKKEDFEQKKVAWEKKKRMERLKRLCSDRPRTATNDLEEIYKEANDLRGQLQANDLVKEADTLRDASCGSTFGEIVCNIGVAIEEFKKKDLSDELAQKCEQISSLVKKFCSQ